MQQRSAKTGRIVRRAVATADWVLVATVLVLGTGLGLVAIQQALRGY